MIRKLALLFMVGMCLLACDQNNDSFENNEIDITVENSVADMAGGSSPNIDEGQSEVSLETSEVSQTETTSTQKNSTIDITDIWVVKSDVNLEDIKIQEEEVTEAKWVTNNELKTMIQNGEFYKSSYKEYYELLSADICLL